MCKFRYSLHTLWSYWLRQISTLHENGQMLVHYGWAARQPPPTLPQMGNARLKSSIYQMDAFFYLDNFGNGHQHFYRPIMFPKIEHSGCRIMVFGIYGYYDYLVYFAIRLGHEGQSINHIFRGMTPSYRGSRYFTIILVFPRAKRARGVSGI